MEFHFSHYYYYVGKVPAHIQVSINTKSQCVGFYCFCSITDMGDINLKHGIQEMYKYEIIQI